MLYSKDDNDCEENAPVKREFDRLPISDTSRLYIQHSINQSPAKLRGVEFSVY